MLDHQDFGRCDLDRTSKDIVVPVGTPSQIVERLMRKYRQLVNDPNFRQSMISDAGIEPMYSSIAEMCEYMHTESSKWAKVVREGGVTVD